MIDRFLTAKEIMALLQVGSTGFNLMVKRGEFPGADIGGGHGKPRRWKESTYKNWANSQGA
ncbi:helix-turn-helix transcriptional regulator [Vibrio proteolyticus]